MTGLGSEVGADVLREGFRAACERVDSRRWERLPGFAFTSLFEALNWAVALDDYLGKHRKEGGRELGTQWRDRVANGDLVRGVRFARNSVHHQWALAFRLSHTPRGPTPVDEPPYQWVWRLSDELPDPKRKDERGRSAYGKHLADTSVRLTLGELGQSSMPALPAGTARGAPGNNPQASEEPSFVRSGAGRRKASGISRSSRSCYPAGLHLSQPECGRGTR